MAMFKKYYLLFCFCTIGAYAFSQTSNTQSPNNNSTYIQTAKDYLNTVAEVYGGFNDIKAKVEITSGAGNFLGTMFIKQPNKFRINFNKPLGQLIVSDGIDFYMYIPSQNVVLHQKKKLHTDSGQSFATKQGLTQLTNNYLVTYFDKPEFSTFSEDPRKKVIKLKLLWKNTSQNFREIILYIGQDNIIYKVEAVTYNREKVQFIFSDFEINEGIPDSRFEYTPTATAHVMDKFLFDEEEEQGDENE